MKLLKNTGITLISLVITIIVLLILAGVSLMLIVGDDGIIRNADRARIETRAGNVEDTVKLWKVNFENDFTLETEEELLEKLIAQKLVEESEINRNTKIITIGDRKISYATNLIELEDDTGKEELILECQTMGMFIDLRFGFENQIVNNNFIVDWGDGTIEEYNEGREFISHYYESFRNL